MNRRSLFSFLAAVPFGAALAAVKGARAEQPLTGFFRRKGPLTAAERAEFKRVFIDPVVSEIDVERLTFVQNELAAFPPHNWPAAELTKGTDGRLKLRAFSPPDNVLALTMRPASAPRDLTASFFGDPLPGYSALEKRG